MLNFPSHWNAKWAQMGISRSGTVNSSDGHCWDELKLERWRRMFQGRDMAFMYERPYERVQSGTTWPLTQSEIRNLQPPLELRSRRRKMRRSGNGTDSRGCFNLISVPNGFFLFKAMYSSLILLVQLQTKRYFEIIYGALMLKQFSKVFKKVHYNPL